MANERNGEAGAHYQLWFDHFGEYSAAPSASIAPQFKVRKPITSAGQSEACATLAIMAGVKRGYLALSGRSAAANRHAAPALFMAGASI
jgi:hypothetical protein